MNEKLCSYHKNALNRKQLVQHHRLDTNFQKTLKHTETWCKDNKKHYIFRQTCHFLPTVCMVIKLI